ncbi:DUF1353 domain-containing protein [Smaragdicoccus niigatensis]|uniref:DUF1353 domain-containing protein n=1 Tax=Smaragdicoccus niigatensis TaxID=359359 RepID=UPI00037CFA24|nr:DUF1353 domain-containing protein [Smaragdicoccus niigatensis]
MTAPLSPVPEPPVDRPAVLGNQASGFFDPNRLDSPPEFLLSRIVSDLGVEEFRLLRPIGYWDAHERGIIVPADLDTFGTDFTSVPALFTWLIPKSGKHLPAALIHDGLVPDYPGEPPTYKHRNGLIDRETADRIFRDALRDLGVSGVRRWLMWTGASLGTLGNAQSWGLRLLVYGWIGAISLLGIAATIDLLPGQELLPWMVGPFWLQVLIGAVSAVVIPFVFSFAVWGRRWRVGAISGVALALLLHVTIALVVVSNIFLAVEAAFDDRLRDAVRPSVIAVAIVTSCVLAGWWALAAG